MTKFQLGISGNIQQMPHLQYLLYILYRYYKWHLFQKRSIMRYKNAIISKLEMISQNLRSNPGIVMNSLSSQP